MKILHLNSCYYPHLVGGAERSVRLLAEAQAVRGHIPIVVSLSPNPGIETAQIGDIKVYYVGLKNIYWPFGNRSVHALAKPLWHALDSYNSAMAAAVRAVCIEEQPDIAHTHNLTGFSVAVWPAIKSLRLPIVHTLRDYSLLCPKTTMFTRNGLCQRQHLSCAAYSLTRSYLSKAVDAVTGVSRYTLDRHLAAGAFRGVPFRRVIYNFRNFAGHGLQPIASRRSKTLRVGFIGKLTPAKGIELLLNTALQLPQSNFHWTVAGSGESDYEKQLRLRFARPNIEFVGQVSDLGTFYSNIDVLAVPSLWHDPCPGVIFEAYAHGVPVLGSGRGGIPEVVFDGKTGLLFDPDAPASLANALHRIRRDPSELSAFSAHCFDARSLFSPERTCDGFDEVYDRVANSKQPSLATCAT
jgi:glycosyltransferase involved in cell wall biosynthesis